MNTDGTGFNTCKECQKTESLRNHITTTDHKEGEQLEDRRNVGDSICNFRDGTDQRVQSLIFMMMMMMMMINHTTVLELLNLRPALYILAQKAAILTTCRIIRTFLTGQWVTSVWSVRLYSLENGLNCCEVRKVDNDDDDGDNDDIIIITIVATTT